MTLDILPKDFCAIAGPSGSGKSTLLNILGALDKPSAGFVYYGDTEITGLPADRLADFRLHKIGFVFQSYNLINTLTALENVEYIMLLQGVPAQERRKRSQEILERVGLAKEAQKFPNQMSGGQQQRVAVARAMVSKPEIILADEPTANLDSKTSESLLDLMMELNRESDMTFVFSTHDPMLMGKVQKLYILKDGEVQS